MADEIYDFTRDVFEDQTQDILDSGNPGEVSDPLELRDYMENMGGYDSLQVNSALLADSVIDFTLDTNFATSRSPLDFIDARAGGYTPYVPPSLDDVGDWSLKPVVRFRPIQFYLDNIDNKALFENPQALLQEVGVQGTWIATPTDVVSYTTRYRFEEDPFASEDDLIRAEVGLTHTSRNGNWQAGPTLFSDYSSDEGDFRNTGVRVNLGIRF